MRFFSCYIEEKASTTATFGGLFSFAGFLSNQKTLTAVRGCGCFSNE